MKISRLVTLRQNRQGQEACRYVRRYVRHHGRHQGLGHTRNHVSGAALLLGAVVLAMSTNGAAAQTAGGGQGLPEGPQQAAPPAPLPGEQSLPPVVVEQPQAKPAPKVKKAAKKAPAKAKAKPAAASPPAPQPAAAAGGAGAGDVAGGGAGTGEGGGGQTFNGIPASDLAWDYSASSATAATKTDTPIFETPAGIQVVPRAVIDDQKAATIQQALENVSGISFEPTLGAFNIFNIRGFRDSTVYRNGLRVASYTSFDTANLQSIEVLKGPAGVLYGRAEPGGLINLVTKKPLDTAYSSVEYQYGSYNFNRTIVDTTGPVTADHSLLYRFTGSYQNNDSFRDFNSTERYQLTPSLTWRPAAGTEITLETEIFREKFRADLGVPASGSRPASIPISRSLQDPNDPLDTMFNMYTGASVKQKLAENWTLNSRFLWRSRSIDQTDIVPAPSFDASAFDEGTGIYQRNILFQGDDETSLGGNVDVTGTVQTYDVKHELLAGADYIHYTSNYDIAGEYITSDPDLDLNVFSPTYGVLKSKFSLSRLKELGFEYSGFRQEQTGVYFQDHAKIWDRLHIVGGLRYDWSGSGRGRSTVSPALSESNIRLNWDEELSWRGGVLYELTPWLAVYGNYSRSFGANNGLAPSGTPLAPQIGIQYEGGFKTELFDKKLSATLAFYQITKDNLAFSDFTTDDPFDVNVGRVRNRGIEFDVAGHVSDTVSLIGNYSYINSEILAGLLGESGAIDVVGHRLANVPEHAGSLWLKYDVNGYKAREGASFGFGAVAKGARMGDNDNTFELPAYVRFDASASYRWEADRGTWITAGLNFKNILDTEYYVGADPNSNCHPRLCILPGDPFTVLATIKVEH